MSADNWGVCPRCRARARKAAVSARRRADAGYGKTPRDEFESLCRQAELAERRVDDPEPTLRFPPEEKPGA